MIEALGWGALAASSLVLGAFLALVRTWSDMVVGLVLGFGAGALIASVSFELAEEGLSVGGAWWPVAAGLAVGGVTFYLANRWVESRSAGSGTGGAAGATLALGAFLDGIPEQAVLGIGLAQGQGISVGARRRHLRLQPPGGCGLGRRHEVGGSQRASGPRGCGAWWPRRCALATAVGYLAADAVSSTTSARD